MRNHLKLCMLGLVFLTGCQSRRPANVRHVSIGIFEVIDCKTSGMTSMSLPRSTEKYCLAAKPVVDETDIRLAEASRDESGNPQVLLYFTGKAGQRMKEATERITAEHRQRKDQGRLAIVMDGTLVEVATLSGVIGGSLVISGAFTLESAHDLAESLNP